MLACCKINITQNYKSDDNELWMAQIKKNTTVASFMVKGAEGNYESHKHN